jgi:membrane protein implicated in regulation of membrane protease activity
LSARGPRLALFARYLALQTPGIFVAGVVLALLVRAGQLTPRVAWGLFAMWVLIELAMFPVMRIAYETGPSAHGPDALVGAVGVARDELVPGETGYVRVGAELWRAVSDDGEPVPPGTHVRVVAVRNLTLRVVRTQT